MPRTFRTPWSVALIVILIPLGMLLPGTKHVLASTVNSCPNLGSTGQCIQILSDQYWKPWSSGVPTLRLVTRSASSPPWGSVIPGTRAQWVYAGDFNTGPARDPREWSVRRFERYLGPGTPRYNVERAIIRITADNGYILYVNGKKVGATFDDVYKRFLPSADWRQFQTYDMTDAIVEHSSNVIMVDVYDYGVAAAFLLDGEIWCKGGATCSAQ
jgi:hypothetical protein